MKTVKSVLSMALAVIMILSLTAPVFADDDGVVQCDYCGEYLMEWGLCPNCGGCSEEANYDCWAEHHCNNCGACLVSEDPSSYCDECHLCCECWDDDEHCDACYVHSSDICTECGLCNDCGADAGMTCFDCGEQCVRIIASILMRMNFFTVNPAVYSVPYAVNAGIHAADMNFVTHAVHARYAVKMNLFIAPNAELVMKKLKCAKAENLTVRTAAEI